MNLEHNSNGIGLNSSLSSQESIVGLCVEDDSQSQNQQRTGSPARRTDENAPAYSWRPPTPPPSLTGTIHNSSHHDRNASDLSSKKEGTRWLHVPSLFDNEKSVDRPEVINSPDSASSTSTSMLYDHSLLLKDESDPSPNKDSTSNMLKFIKPKKRRIKAASRITRTINTLLKQDDSQGEPDENDSAYQMMKSQHGPLSRSAPETLDSSDVSFFYNGIEELEAQRQLRSNLNSRSSTNDHQGYFDHQTRRKFNEAHALLNADMGTYHDDDESEDDDGMDYDFTTLFTFGCSPTSRANRSEREQDAMPAIADITNSSLSYISNGRIQMRLRGDNVRLVMDEFLEPGILSVENDLSTPFLPSSLDDTDTSQTHELRSAKGIQDENYCPNIDVARAANRNLLQEIDEESNAECDEELQQQELTPGEATRQHIRRHSQKLKSKRLPDLRYLLTVDQNLYKSIIKEVPDSRMPCGLYFCCHDAVDGSRHVNISVAIIILSVVFILLFVGTCIWPTD